jgi:hypothetical protein
MLKITIVDNDQDFLGLEHDWRTLIDHCPNVSYFLTWEFTHERWRHFSANRQLWVLIARDDDGRLVGIAPFAIGRTSLGPLEIRRLEFICRVEIPFRFDRYYLDGEGLDIIAHPDYRSEVSAGFQPYLKREHAKWDIIDLAWLSPDAILRTHFLTARSRAREQVSPCPVATLPDNFDDYDKMVLEKGQSKQNHYKARRLNRDFPDQVVIHRVTEADEVGPAMDNLDEMKLLRWAEQGEAAPDSNDPHVRQHKQFERDFARHAFERGWLRFYQMKVNGEIIAANFGMALHHTFYLLNKGFDPAWKKHSPGYVLQAYEIEQAISEGLTEYNLGHGLMETKRMWVDQERNDVRLLASFSRLGALYLARERGWAAAKSAARKAGRRALSDTRYSRIAQTVRNTSRRMRRSGSGTE